MFRRVIVLLLALFWGAVIVQLVNDLVLIYLLAIAIIVALIWAFIRYKRNQQNRYAQKPQPVIRPGVGE